MQTHPLQQNKGDICCGVHEMKELKTAYQRDVTERNIIVRKRTLCFFRQHGMMKSRQGATALLTQSAHHGHS
jgi:hypothetical protein